MTTFANLSYSGDTLSIKTSNGISAQESISESIEFVWKNHTKIVYEMALLLKAPKIDIDPELQEDVLEDTVSATINRFLFERLAAWRIGHLLRSKVGDLGHSIDVSGVNFLPSEIPVEAFLAGWNEYRIDKKSKSPIESVALSVALAISLMSNSARFLLGARSRIPPNTECVVITPTAPNNQARHGLALASRTASTGKVSVAVLFGHGLFGLKRSREVRQLCGAAVRVWPWSLTAYFLSFRSIVAQATRAQRIAQQIHRRIGYPFTFSDRIYLCERLARSEIFSRWAKKQQWPRSVSFSIATRLDGTRADRTIQKLGSRTAHLIHGVHAAGNVWSYRGISTLAVTMLESETALRREGGRYKSVRSIRDLVGELSENSVSLSPIKRRGILLVCTNLIHLSSPWMHRKSEARHLEILQSCVLLSQMWGCAGVVWRPHPAGRVHAPERMAALEQEVVRMGIGIDSGSLEVSVESARFILTTPSGVVADVLSLGKMPFVLDGILKDVHLPWTEIPKDLWIDVDHPHDAAPSKEIEKISENHEHFRSMRNTFSGVTWNAVTAEMIDFALWNDISNVDR